MREWASLERGVLRDILTRLPADADVVSFRHVCHNWRAAAGVGAQVPRPWFVLSRPSVDGDAHAYVHPAQRHGRSRIRAVHMEDAGVREECAPIRGSSRGWLAVSEGNLLLLRDPISLVEVPLPGIDPVCQLFSVFLSDDPLADPVGYTVFAFFKKTDCPYMGHLLAFCRPGDNEWTRIDGDDVQPGNVNRFRALEVFQGRAYVLLLDYTVAVCDLNARRLVKSSVKLDFSGTNEIYSQECLVEGGGDLLFVRVSQIFKARRRLPCCFGRSYDLKFSARVIKIEVDVDGMPAQRSDALEIRDYAVFLQPSSRGHAFALPASGFPAVKAGCIYHLSAHHITENVSGMVVSDLRRRPHRHENVRNMPLAGLWHPLSWFCPRRPILVDAAKKKRA